MIKINSNTPIKKQIDCPYCYSLLQWDSGQDITIISGNKYIQCPECGQMIQLQDKKNYFVNENSSSDSDSKTLIVEAQLIKSSNNPPKYDIQQLNITPKELLNNNVIFKLIDDNESIYSNAFFMAYIPTSQLPSGGVYTINRIGYYNIGLYAQDQNSIFTNVEPMPEPDGLLLNYNDEMAD